MAYRTDLAVESYEEQGKTKLNGVIVREQGNITTVRVTDEHGAAALGKPIGNYVTLRVKSFVSDTDIFDGRLTEFAAVLRRLLPPDPESILVAGLGNPAMTADALGPKTNRYVLATRHLTHTLQHTVGLQGLSCVACVATGVLGETGLESAELIQGIAGQMHPSCIITVDALAASSVERLGTTVQFSDSGIAPGSGVGNHRGEISRKTVGVPVIAIGIPTVVSTAVMAPQYADAATFVTPREIDRITEHGARLIGMGINVCLHCGLDARDLYALVG